MQLKDFEMMPTETPNGVQAVLKFGDAYELSIVQNEISYGNKKGLYEIGVFKNGVMTEMPGITNDNAAVRGYLTEADVDGIISKMFYATGAKPEQI